MSDQPPQSHQEAEGSLIAQAAPGGIAIVGNENIIYSLSPAEAKEWRNLKILLAKVKQFWIEGFLKNSLYNEVLLQLGKESRLDAVEHPWERVMEIRDKPRQSLPPEAKISDIFDEMNRAMLVLGEPGSGKTITLLELTRDLITRAEQDPTYSQPVPVVFNLSSWPGKSKLFLEWLVEELSAKYYIHSKLGRNWLESNRILPLLDGLDEMPEEYRASCVEAINNFGSSYGLSGMAVCCRSEEYSQIPARLKFNGAIYLQSLTLDQVDDYLTNAGPELTGLRTSLKSDESFLALSRTPLMLNIMTLSYKGASADELAIQVESPSDGRKHLFDTYIEHMFTRKGVSGETFTNGQTKKWLSWIAQKLLQHDQSIFLIEKMQPSWLGKGRQRLGYKLLAGLLVGLFIGLVSGLFAVMLTWLFVGLMAWLMQRMFSDFSLGIPVIVWLFGGQGLLIGLGIVLLFGLFVGWIFWLEETKNIKPTEVLTWSWSSVRQISVRRMISYLSFGLFLVMLGGGIYGLIFGLLFVLIFVLGKGLESGELSERTIPNQGIRQSAKNFVIIGLLCGLGIWLVLGLIWMGFEQLVGQELLDVLADEPLFGLYRLILSLAFGLFIGLALGGEAVIQHLILRLLLWRSGIILFRLVPFLNFCVDRIFLRRVGGGYIFIHRMLMEHFAEMEFTEE